MLYLLWFDRLPTSAELQSFESEIRSHYPLSDDVKEMIRATPKTASPMHVLRTMVSALAHDDQECNDQSVEAEERKALRILAKTPAIIAGFDRHRRDLPMVDPDPNLNIANNFLLMLNGELPGEQTARALDVCLILHADHGINASTFAAMVAIGTQSDMYSAVTAAIGTLRGPLHGGANERVMHMLEEIGDLDKVEEFITGRLERKEKVPGFGHRVYKAYDPRAKYLKTFAKTIAEETGNHDLFEMSRTKEGIMEDAV